jgi:hypothetical protein
MNLPVEPLSGNKNQVNYHENCKKTGIAMDFKRVWN